MFCVGLILYEMLLPPMPNALERYNVFQEARVLFIFAFVSFRLGVCDPKSKSLTEILLRNVSKCFFYGRFKVGKPKQPTFCPRIDRYASQ